MTSIQITALSPTEVGVDGGGRAARRRIAAQTGMPSIRAIGMAGTASRTLAAITRVTMKMSDAKRRVATPKRFSSSA